MNLPTLIPDLTVSQFTELTPAQLQEGFVSLQALQAAVKQALDRMNAVLEMRYGERAHQARLAVENKSAMKRAQHYISPDKKSITIPINELQK